MLKRIITVAMLLCAVVVTVDAQDAPQGKKRMFVEWFFGGDHVPDDIVDMVRDKALSGLNDTKRFNLVDAASEQSMNKEKEHRSAEQAMADAKTRNEMISAAGHDYIFSGNVSKYIVSEKKDSEGNKGYVCSIIYTYSVTEVATSTTVATKTFERGGSGLLTSCYPTVDKARESALSLVDNDIESFLITEFPLEGVLLPMDYEVKKDKLLTCYVELGSDVGVKVGDFFTVYVPTVRAGRSSYNEVAQIKVTEVIDGTLSFCKVTKGAKEALVALNAFLDLDEATRTKQPIKIKSCVAPLISF